MLNIIKKYISFDHNSHKHMLDKLAGVETYEAAIALLIENGFLISPFIKKAIKAEANGEAPKGAEAAEQTKEEIEAMAKAEAEAKAEAIKTREAEDKKLVEETKAAFEKEKDAIVAKAVAEALDAKAKEAAGEETKEEKVKEDKKTLNPFKK